jgi:hypothetical protein
MNTSPSVRCNLPLSCSRLMIVTTLLFVCPALVLAQGARVNSSTDVLSDPDRDNVELRERWFYRGRVAPARESAAELRYRAHRQKLFMRSVRARQASAGAAVGASPLAPAITWTSLGPAPLASDSTSQEFQDYGLVSGRTTAVVVDPADPTGNTVYVGGAYGGVWRSQNAAAGSYGNASAVT